MFRKLITKLLNPPLELLSKIKVTTEDEPLIRKLIKTILPARVSEFELGPDENLFVYFRAISNHGESLPYVEDFHGRSLHDKVKSEIGAGDAYTVDDHFIPQLPDLELMKTYLYVLEPLLTMEGVSMKDLFTTELDPQHERGDA